MSFIGAGTCVINANQAGNANYNAAPQVQQSFAVGKGTADDQLHVDGAGGRGGRRADLHGDGDGDLGSGGDVHHRRRERGRLRTPGSTVSFISAGTCVINANQAGNANYNAAQVQQSFAVARGQTISFTSTAPSAVYQGTYTVAATATSGLAVALTIDATSSAVCAIAGATVAFHRHRHVRDRRQPGRERELHRGAAGAAGLPGRDDHTQGGLMVPPFEGEPVPRLEPMAWRDS